MMQLPLTFEPDSIIQLAVGFTRQIPSGRLEEHLAASTPDSEIQEARHAVVENLLNLKRSVAALDTLMGFDPKRWERGCP